MVVQNESTLPQQAESIKYPEQLISPVKEVFQSKSIDAAERLCDILVVDDRSNWLELIIATFDGLYRCDTAANFQEALKKARSGKFRVITMNWWLPSRNDGRKLLEFLNANYPTTPVVLISGEFQGTLDEIDQINSRYPNVKKILIKGQTPNQESKFVEDLTKITFELLANPVVNGEAERSLIEASAPIVKGLASVSLESEKPHPTFTWLHLSDLHIGCTEANRGWAGLKKALLNDIQQHLKPSNEQPKHCAQVSLKPDAIFVTGDIAYRAAEDEFAEAESLVGAIWAITGLEKSQTFLVPGNHDTDRKMIEKDFVYGLTYKELANSQLNQEDWFDALNKIWQHKSLTEWLDAKFKRYKQFANTCMAVSGNQLYYTSEIPVLGGRIGILGVNSALMSWRDGEDRERGLWVGKPQLDEIEELLSQDVLFRISLIHHPREALHEHDIAWDRLQQLSSILLHGHLHKPKVNPSGEPEREHVCLPGGSVHEGGIWHHQRYSYGQIDLETGELSIYLRMTRPGEYPLYIRDNLTYPKAAADGHLSIRLPTKS